MYSPKLTQNRHTVLRNTLNNFSPILKTSKACYSHALIPVLQKNIGKSYDVQNIQLVESIHKNRKPENHKKYHPNLQDTLNSQQKQLKEFKFAESNFFSDEQQQSLVVSGSEKEISVVEIHGTKGFNSLEYDDAKSNEQKQKQFILLEKTRYQVFKDKINFLQKQNMTLLEENEKLRKIFQSHRNSLNNEQQGFKNTLNKNIPTFLKQRAFNKAKNRNKVNSSHDNPQGITFKLNKCVQSIKQNLNVHHAPIVNPIIHNTNQITSTQIHPRSPKAKKNFQKIIPTIQFCYQSPKRQLLSQRL